jgi:hypothetical protein
MSINPLRRSALSFAASAVAVTLLTRASAFATVSSPTLVFPPPNTQYVTPAGTSVSYPGSGSLLDITGLTMLPTSSGVSLSTSATTTSAVWPSNGDDDYTKNGTVGETSVSFTSSIDIGPDGTQGTAPAGYRDKLISIKICSWAEGSELERVSPTIPSTGEFDYQPQPDGSFQIYSFFDVFTELSTDGGLHWTPASAPLHFDLVSSVPEPTAFSSLILVGIPLLARRRRAPDLHGDQ